MNILKKAYACGFLAFSFISAAPPDTLTFLHVSDTHISNMTGYHPGLIASCKEKISDPTTLEQLIVQKPLEFGADLVVHTGDMVHFYEAEIKDDRLLATQIEQFSALALLCPAPFFSVLGNHDLRSYRINDQDNSVQLNQLHSQKARAAWSRNLACFQDGFYYQRIFPVGKINYRLFFLDNGYDLKNGEWLDQAQFDWLRYEMNQTGNDPVIMFMHKYLPALDYNNDRQSFAAARAPALNDSTCAKGFLQVLNEHRNIRLLLVGHGHSRKSEMLPFPKGHQIAQFSPGAYVKNVHNWRMIKCTENEIIIFAPGTNEIEFNLLLDANEVGNSPQ